MSAGTGRRMLRPRSRCGNGCHSLCLFRTSMVMPWMDLKTRAWRFPFFLAAVSTFPFLFFLRQD